MKVETKVGALFLLAVALVAAFAYYLGVLNPFSQTYDLTLGYNYAGGIELGSPVRVMGVNVGKVSEIAFDPGVKIGEDEVRLKIKVQISKRAWPTLRKNSKFFINLAGVIGEKLIEVVPGTGEGEMIEPGSFIRGEDPPRIDQLISQSYGLAGKILEMVEKNEGSVTDTVEKINSLVTNLNKTLVLLDKTSKSADIGKILGNVGQLTEDLTIATSRLRGPEAQKTMDLIHKLVWRLDALDEENIRKFLQKEGIRARLF